MLSSQDQIKFVMCSYQIMILCNINYIIIVYLGGMLSLVAIYTVFYVMSGHAINLAINNL